MGLSDLDEWDFDVERSSSSDKRIMIIEDDDEIRELFAIILKKEGFQYEAAVDGETGLNKIRQWMPDLILLDLMLPRQGGWEVLRQLQTGETSGIPVIIVTGRFSDRAMSDLIRQESNVVEFIEKPIRPDIFAMTLHKILKTMPPNMNAGGNG